MTDCNSEQGEERDFGVQPLDAYMEARGLENHDLVNASLEQLTHKQVQRARKGRQLTLKMMQKVARAYNVALFNRLNQEQQELFVEYIHRHLFSYAKGYDAEAKDINEALFSNSEQKGL